MEDQAQSLNTSSAIAQLVTLRADNSTERLHVELAQKQASSYLSLMPDDIIHTICEHITMVEPPLLPSTLKPSPIVDTSAYIGQPPVPGTSFLFLESLAFEMLLEPQGPQEGFDIQMKYLNGTMAFDAFNSLQIAYPELEGPIKEGKRHVLAHKKPPARAPVTIVMQSIYHGDLKHMIKHLEPYGCHNLAYLRMDWEVMPRQQIQLLSKEFHGAVLQTLAQTASNLKEVTILMFGLEYNTHLYASLDEYLAGWWDEWANGMSQVIGVCHSNGGIAIFIPNSNWDRRDPMWGKLQELGGVVRWRNHQTGEIEEDEEKAARDVVGPESAGGADIGSDGMETEGNKDDGGVEVDEVAQA